MSRGVRKQDGFVLLEALGAICVLTLTLGSLTLLLTVSASVKRQSLIRVQMRHLLTGHLEELRAQIGSSPDCSLLLNDIRQGSIQGRTFQFSRTIQSPEWDGAAPAPPLLQLTVATIPDPANAWFRMDVSVLQSCNPGAP